MNREERDRKHQLFKRRLIKWSLHTSGNRYQSYACYSCRGLVYEAYFQNHVVQSNLQMFLNRSYHWLPWDWLSLVTLSYLAFHLSINWSPESFLLLRFSVLGSNWDLFKGYSDIKEQKENSSVSQWGWGQWWISKTPKINYWGLMNHVTVISMIPS